MKQVTAKTTHDVRDWVENTPHYFASKEDPKFFIIRGRSSKLRIPYALFKQCYLKPGEEFDNRMYRWDFEKEVESF